MHERTIRREPLDHGWSMRVDELWLSAGQCSRIECYAVRLEHADGSLVPPGFDGKIKTPEDVQTESRRLIRMAAL